MKNLLPNSTLVRRSTSFRSKTSLLSLFALAAISSNSFATVYTWTGLVDGDWNDAGNWDANGVPVDDQTDNANNTDNNAGLTLDYTDSVVFAGSAMPTNNPDIGGLYDNTDSGKWSSPTMIFNSGGAISFTAVARDDAFWTNAQVDLTILTVGDGTGGGTEDVQVTISSLTNLVQLNRHHAVTHDYTVNSDGTLTFSKRIDFSYQNGNTANPDRFSTFTIDGGSVVVNGEVFDATNLNNYVDFTAVGGSFTAEFGIAGDFSHIGAVISSLGTSNVLGTAFRNSAGGALDAVDNLDGTFTVSAVPSGPFYSDSGFGDFTPTDANAWGSSNNTTKSVILETFIDYTQAVANIAAMTGDAGEFIICELGGTGNGSGIAIAGDNIYFAAGNAGAGNFAVASGPHGLTAGDTNVQVLAVFEVNGGTDTNELLSLYVDGNLIATTDAPTSGDWAGADPSYLGGTSPNNFFVNVAPFNGNTAAINGYPDQANTSIEFNAYLLGGDDNSFVANTVENILDATVLGGDFQMYKDNTLAVTAEFDSSGVFIGNVTFDPISEETAGGAGVVYSDGSPNGTTVHLPGWTRSGGTTDLYIGGSSGGGALDSALHIFAGGATGTFVTSSAALARPTLGVVGQGFKISVRANGVNAADVITFELLLDGVVVPPDSEVSPTLSTTYQTYSRTYNSLAAGDLTIRMGKPIGSSGGRARFDDVRFSTFSLGSAPITWGAPTAVSTTTGNSSDVSTNGLLVEAYNARLSGNSGTSQTVNGVTFLPTIDLLPSDLNSNPNFSIATAGGDAAYNEILSAADFGGGQTSTIVLGDGDGDPGTLSTGLLQAGELYEIQVWIVDDRGTPGAGPDNRVMGLAGSSTGSLAELNDQYVIGTFTANAPTQTLFMNAIFPAPATQFINAYQIRKVQPTWTSTWPQVDGVTDTSFTARAKTDKDGKAYYVTLADGAAAPSSAQVKAGTDSSDSAALQSGSIALTADTENTAAVTGLTENTAYDVWFVSEDDVFNLQTTPVKVNITTLTTTYDDWLTDFDFSGFTSPDLTSNGNPDTDGLVNIEEFAYGTDPTSSFSGSIVYDTNGDVTTPGLPVATNLAAGGGVDFRAIFGRRKNYVTAGLTYTVQFSADMSVWVDSAAIPDILTGAGSSGDIEAVSVPYPLFIPVGAGFEKPTFFRVGVSSN